MNMGPMTILSKNMGAAHFSLDIRKDFDWFPPIRVALILVSLTMTVNFYTDSEIVSSVNEMP